MIHRAWRWVMRFDLSDEDWALLEPLLRKSRKSARVDDRKIMNAIFYVLRTGMPWRDLPARYGPYTTAYNRFNRWSRRGIWNRIFDQLASKSRDSLYLIDSTIVKAHRAASGAKGGRKIRRSVSVGAAEPLYRTSAVCHYRTSAVCGVIAPSLPYLSAAVSHSGCPSWHSMLSASEMDAKRTD